MHIFSEKLLIPFALLIIHMVISTIGYCLITNWEYSIIDCLYMTVITITTIGYSEIVNLENNPAGRVFTVFVAFFGIGILSYIISNVTAYVLEGELNKNYRRKRMEKSISKLTSHYILCGSEDVAYYIIKELIETGREFVIIDSDEKKLERLDDTFNKIKYLVGDPTDAEILLKAGINNSNGVFVVGSDDNTNIVITMTARSINADVRIVTHCKDVKNIDKIKKAGADSVISPTFIGGLRMTSEMVRPTVVSFLDMMLRDKEKNLRIEEVDLPEHFIGKTVEFLNLKKFRDIMLLAINHSDGWIYNPPEDYNLSKGDKLIIMTTTKERVKLEKMLSNKI
ncbi:potassium channel family protein [Calditerrivibrio nitroreducens]|uniref:TrkA-N domain protein n=1 Tax=Calditerrivibrio nitroreducens (strain DSM 19672 / NBRC 101217 / Yu37-1) TaxID=768670 RepID=E4TEV0_CALNY|nr:potassium channel protein [Calditerrivibrio nitroreducens]ADR18356.1 TrkA-N domain protein [Calditerrivibrio nitroreducens DSM 19672]